MTTITENDRKIVEMIGSKHFTLSAEVIPPRNGAEQVKILSQISRLVECGAEFLSVTKGAGGSLRGGSLPIAFAIKENFGLPCIAHFTCRDLTPQEIENQLIDHHYFGIRNILALRGDPPMGQPEWRAKEGSYNYAYELIEQIVKLNHGEFLPRPGGPQVKETTQTDFCIGAAAYPEHPDKEERLRFFKCKHDAGAEYGITQMLFDIDAYRRFVDDLGKNGIDIPIVPGTRILKNKDQARRMAARFAVSVPDSLMQRLPEKDDPDADKKSLDAFLEYGRQLQEIGAPGVHLFVLSDTEISCRFLKAIG